VIILDVVWELLLSPAAEILADVKVKPKLAEARSLDGPPGCCPRHELNQLSKNLLVLVIKKACHSF